MDGKEGFDGSQRSGLNSFILAVDGANV